MSDETRAPRAVRSAARRAISLATSLPAMALLACALLVDAILLPDASACCLLRGTRRSDPVTTLRLVRSEGHLHAAFSAEDWSQTAGVVRVYTRTAPDRCFWAPVFEIQRVRIAPSLMDGAGATSEDLASIGADVADQLGAEGAPAKHIELLRRGGGSERRPLPLGCAHNLAAATAALFIVCGITRAIRSELHSSRERQRLGRDQCPGCGYPRTGGPPGPCPECGRL
jgi:hypothetical protein